ncbi:hypothetical protein AB4144_22160, partial [Rhizobiaceae sp. 2RAB30]
TQSTNPSLGGGFTPSLWSPARDKGDPAGCMADVVQAIDIYGSKRLAKGLCSIGAVEADLERDISRALPSPLAQSFSLWWLWILLFILILAFLIGLLIGLLRKSKKSRAERDLA